MGFALLSPCLPRPRGACYRPHMRPGTVQPRPRPPRAPYARAAVALALALAVGPGLAPARAAPPPVILVRGTASTPNASERQYADSVTRFLSRLLDGVRVPHDVLTDEEVRANRLAGVRVVILGYNPVLPAAEREALRLFVQQGGRLIVCYSSDPALAALLNMQLGAYQSCERADRWNVIVFNRFAPAHLPARVRQCSRNIRPVLPIAKRSRVIASWQSANGTAPGDAAWVQSAQGAWLSHVVLNDGDTAAKQHMLLGLLAGYAPELWEPAGRWQFQQAETLARYRDFADASRQITELAAAAGSPRTADVIATLRLADRTRRAIQAQAGRGDWAEVFTASASLRLQMLAAYARAQAPCREGFRGVWDHTGAGLYPGDWPRTCRVLADSGLTDVLVNVLWPGLGHYASRTLSASPTVRLYGDQLAASTAAARQTGLWVHAWKVCWYLDATPRTLVARWRAAGRLQVSDTGKPLDWLCPSHPENVQLELQGIREVAQRYPVSGIHLDYIRYPDSHACFCPGCRARFEASLGRRVARWPADAREGALRQAWTKWRCAQITAFVQTVRRELKAINPTLRLSASVFGKYPSCVDAVAQDWPAWLRAGDVDFVCPMNYTDSPTAFSTLVGNQLSLPQTAGRIMPGIGVTSVTSQLDAVQVIDQIVTARRLGAAGFALFDLDAALEQDILPYLRAGVTSDTLPAPRRDAGR